MNWILDNIIAVYTMAEQRNDFFILHGITSAWALSQFLPVIKSEETRLEICQLFLCVLLAVYVAKDRPQLHAEYLGSDDDLVSIS
jgi:20S proteasome subunit beta 1